MENPCRQRNIEALKLSVGNPITPLFKKKLFWYSCLLRRLVVIFVIIL